MPSDLDSLQGSWAVRALEMEGQAMPAEMLSGARVAVQGDRFTTTGMGAEYAGAIQLDASRTPRHIDMKFDTGPEAGNTNLGIYELEGSTWRLCLATHGPVRPEGFASTPGSGIAVETLERVDAAAPAPAAKKAKKGRAAAPASSGAATVFEGEWPMVSGVMSGKPMDPSLVRWVKRVTTGNQTTVMAGPQAMMKVEFTSDSSQSPKTIDYVNLAGANKGKAQQGIYELEGDLLKVCVAAPGTPRPGEFESVPGDGRTFTVWRRG